MLHKHRDAESVTPQVKQDFIDTANRILDAGATGFGEIAVLHLSLLASHPFEEVSSTHPLLSSLVEIADQRKALIDLHMDPVTAAIRCGHPRRSRCRRIRRRSPATSPV